VSVGPARPNPIGLPSKTSTVRPRPVGDAAVARVIQAASSLASLKEPDTACLPATAAGR